MARSKLANIWDPVKPTLDPLIFKGTTPRENYRHFVQDTFNKAIAKALPGIDPEEYFDLYLTGSLTTYQWGETSDSDISVFPWYEGFAKLGIDAQELRNKLIAFVVENLDGTYIPGTQHPLQYFIQNPETTPDQIYKAGMRSGYSLEDDMWVVPPEWSRSKSIERDLPTLYGKATAVAEKMRILLDENPDAAIELFENIHKSRQLSERAGEGDYSEANIVYKFLLHEGLFDRLRDLGVKISAAIGSHPAPGTISIPSNYIRLFHYSTADAETLRQEGLRYDKARGENYGEPNMIWASTRFPEAAAYGKNVVEFAVPHNDSRWDIGKYQEGINYAYPDEKKYGPDAYVEHMNKGARDVTFFGDIKPDEILHVHEPWESTYRYIDESPGILDDPFALDYAFTMDDPTAQAVFEWKRDHGLPMGENEQAWAVQRTSAFDIPYDYQDYVYPVSLDRMPPRLYHAAPKAAREDILQNGLDPTDRTWNTPGDDEWRPEGIYMWPHQHEARQYADGWDMDIWEIDPSKVSYHIIQDPSVAFNWDEDPDWQAYVTNYVGPKAIRLVNPEEHLSTSNVTWLTLEDFGLQYGDDFGPSQPDPGFYRALYDPTSDKMYIVNAKFGAPNHNDIHSLIDPDRQNLYLERAAVNGDHLYAYGGNIERMQQILEQELGHPLTLDDEKFGKVADYQGYTNWDTFEAMSSVDGELYNEITELIDNGMTEEQMRDWFIQKIIGPYNAQRMQEAKDWNSIPKEERIDYRHEEFVEQNPSAADFVNGITGGPNVEDYDPDLIDAELVNWDEIYNDLTEGQEEEANYEQEMTDLKNKGYGWPSNIGENNVIMVDAFYRHFGAAPEGETQGFKDPRAYHNISLHLSPEDMKAGATEYRYPEDFIDSETRLKIWYLIRERANDPNMSGYEADQNIDYSDPDIQAIVSQDPKIQEIEANGYDYSLSSLTHAVIGAIQKSRPNPYIPVMLEALKERGYNDQQIAEITKPVWSWDGENWQRVDEQPLAPADTTIDQPGTETFPEEWLSHMAGEVKDVLKVIYDSETDTIIIGTTSQAANIPAGKIIGEYTNGKVYLYDAGVPISLDYFKNLWQHSWQDLPLHSVEVTRPLETFSSIEDDRMLFDELDVQNLRMAYPRAWQDFLHAIGLGYDARSGEYQAFMTLQTDYGIEPTEAGETAQEMRLLYERGRAIRGDIREPEEYERFSSQEFPFPDRLFDKLHYSMRCPYCAGQLHRELDNSLYCAECPWREEMDRAPKTAEFDEWDQVRVPYGESGVPVWRGLTMKVPTQWDMIGQLSDEDLAERIRYYIETNSMLDWETLGIHWTTDRTVAERFSTPRIDEGGFEIYGLLMEGLVMPEDIVQMGTDEYTYYAQQAGVVGPNSGEKEITIRPGAHVRILSGEAKLPNGERIPTPNMGDIIVPVQHTYIKPWQG